MKFKYIYGTICILKIERSIKMPDSEELNEILKEIKNINAPKEEKPKKPEAPLSFAKQEKEAPKAAEPEFKPEIKEEPKKENLSFDDFSAFNSADRDNAPKVTRKEAVNMANDKKPPKKGNKKPIIIAIVAVLIVAIAVAAAFIVKNKSKEPQTTAPQTTQEQTTATPVMTKTNPLTGESDFNEKAIGKRPIACVVENSVSARPQWGIADSKNPPDIIVEGEVEGGETRMLWMYADYTAVPSQIGPMRSARPPYIKFSELFDAIFLHWGQSQTKRGTNYIGANTIFRQDKVDHINQMTYSGKVALFGRDSSRGVSTEHTGVMYGSKIAGAIKGEGFRTDANESKYTKFNFASEESTVSDKECKTLGLTFSNRTSTRDWTYDSSDKMYHSNDYKTDVARKNLLVLFDKTEYVSKSNYKNSGSAEVYCNYKLAGGKGKLATNGTVIDINWSVNNGVLVIKDTNGNDVKLNVGTTWIGYASSNNGGAVK